MRNTLKYILSITPVVFLIIFLSVVNRVYGIDALSGPGQLVLIVSTGIAALIILWSTCGMTQSTVLNVPTLTYLPYCFFNILTPVTSIIIAATGFRIYRTVRKAADN